MKIDYHPLQKSSLSPHKKAPPSSSSRPLELYLRRLLHPRRMPQLKFHSCAGGTRKAARSRYSRFLFFSFILVSLRLIEGRKKGELQIGCDSYARLACSLRRGALGQCSLVFRALNSPLPACEWARCVAFPFFQCCDWRRLFFYWQDTAVTIQMSDLLRLTILLYVLL